MDDNKALERAEIIAALRSISTGHALSNDLCMDVGWRRVCSLGADLIEQLTAEPPNEPLTLEELRGMDGEPVWIVEHPDWGHWELSAYAEDYLEDRDEDFYGMTMPKCLPDPMGKYGLHMLGWLAYRRKPEEETT